jgi:hypothetical protein
VTSATGDYNIAKENTAVDIVNSIDIIVEFDSKTTTTSGSDSGCEYYA